MLSRGRGAISRAGNLSPVRELRALMMLPHSGEQQRAGRYGRWDVAAIRRRGKKTGLKISKSTRCCGKERQACAVGITTKPSGAGWSEVGV